MFHPTRFRTFTLVKYLLKNAAFSPTPPLMKLQAFLFLAALSPLCAQSSSNFSVIQAVQETVGTSYVVSDSGTKANTDLWTTGQVGRFIVSDGLSSYGLQVDALNPTGVLLADTDSLMVVRTSDSQGLKDTGTLSIYVNPGNTSTQSGAWSLDVRFSFWDVNFSEARDVTILLTSLDIDHGQKYYTDSKDFVSNDPYASSLITSTTAIGDYTGFTAAGDSRFNDPKHAISSTSKHQSEFDVKLAHNNVALFMFEFRNPSQVVPEPSAAMLMMSGSLLMLARRRRA